MWRVERDGTEGLGVRGSGALPVVPIRKRAGTPFSTSARAQALASAIQSHWCTPRGGGRAPIRLATQGELRGRSGGGKTSPRCRRAAAAAVSTTIKKAARSARIGPDVAPAVYWQSACAM